MAASTQGSPREERTLTSRVALTVSTVAIAAVLAIPLTAMAARGGGTTTAWIRLSVPEAAVAAAPSLGARVTFESSYPKTVKNPRIEVLCYQGSELVYGEAGAPTDSFLLGGAWSVWKERGGSAECVANLFYFGFRQGRQTYEWLAATRFTSEG